MKVPAASVRDFLFFGSFAEITTDGFKYCQLEITTLIITFDHYDQLVSRYLVESAGSHEEHDKIRQKSTAHLSGFIGDTAFYDENKGLKQLSDIKTLIKAKLAGFDAKVIHELVEKLEKDAKKMKKLYKALQQV